MRQEQLERIQAACTKAHPEAELRMLGEGGEVRLSDVLLAIAASQVVLLCVLFLIGVYWIGWLIGQEQGLVQGYAAGLHDGSTNKE